LGVRKDTGGWWYRHGRLEVAVIGVGGKLSIERRLGLHVMKSSDTVGDIYHDKNCYLSFLVLFEREQSRCILTNLD
jgi:hypothetical protein